jgi:hypothetical protein
MGYGSLKRKTPRQKEGQMKATTKTMLAALFLGLSCLSSTGLAGPSDTSCSITIPAGTIIRVYPDERIVGGTTAGPLLFTVAADVRFFLNRPPILPRGSKILGKIEQSNQAGRLWGRAKAQPVFTSILTPDFCEYAIDATLIEAKKYRVREGVIVGQGHPRRDTFALLFPPTTLYQLIRLPARGPKLTVSEEDQLVIKLLQPVHVVRAESNPLATSAPIEQTRHSASALATVYKPPSLECRTIASSRTALTAQSRISRSFQNTTPYHVVVYGNGTPIGTIAPCSESAFVVPRGELKMRAIATIPEDNGQREVEVFLGLNDNLTGWQVLSLDETSLTIR